MFGNCGPDERRRGVHQCDGADDHCWDCLVAVGDRAHDCSVTRVGMDVAPIHRDSGTLEARTEPLTEDSTGAPEELDGLDSAIGDVPRWHDPVSVQLGGEPGHQCSRITDHDEGERRPQPFHDDHATENGNGPGIRSRGRRSTECGRGYARAASSSSTALVSSRGSLSPNCAK
jgi:hypothetical protein